MPIHEWDDQVKTVKQVILTRMSNDRTDSKFNMYISEPVLITLKPDETTSPNTLISVNFIQANFDFTNPDITSMLSYLSVSDFRQIYSRKLSITCEWIDGDEPNPVNNPSTGMREVSHTGPSFDGGSDGGSYSSLYLHSGEFFVEEVDAAVPGRGFDFVFKRRYESRATYSGVLGWGWDHQYNTRLVELYTGDILYFDGNGRRERYKAIKNGIIITDYESPTGYFTQLVKRVDGTFCIKYAQGFMEIFNSKGRLICLQDTNNNKMYFYYDISGQLAMIKDTLGKEYVFEYYPYARNDKRSNRLKKLYVMNEYQLLYEYDNYGRLIKVTRSLTSKPNIKRSKQYDYYNMGGDIKLSYNLKSITDAKNQKYLAVEYDSNDKVKILTRGTDKVEVTAGANASTLENRDGITIQRLYFHNNSYHIKTSEVEGYLTHYDYNPHGLITKIAYPLGNEHRFIYDDNNLDRRSRGNLRFFREIAGSGGVLIETEYRYQSYVNRVNYIKDGMGNETNLDVNNLTGNVNSVTFADNTMFEYKYNSNGQLIREIIPHSQDPATGQAITSTNIYDYYPDTFPVMAGYLARIILDRDEDKITREFNYNQLGDVVLNWDGEGVATNYKYEDDYTKVTVIEGSNDSTDNKPPVNFTTVLTFDANLNLETEKSAGIITTNTFDMLNRIKTLTRKGESDGKTQSMSFEYDSSGNLFEIVNPRGFKDTFKYNDRDLVIEKHLGNGLSVEKYQYNGNGLLEFAWDGENKMTQYKYDGFGRLHEIIDPKLNKITYDYDNNSNQTLMEALGTDGKSLKFEYDYNNVNQLTYKKLKHGGMNPGYRTTEFGYTPAGDVASVINPRLYKYEIRRTGSGLVHKIIDPLQNYTERKYDGRGLVKEIKAVDKKSQDTLTTTIDYDKLGKMSLYNDDLLRKYETIYNPQHQRPETFKNPKEGEITYKYDGLGRAERVIKTVKSEDETRQYETVYGYDANNNVVSITDPSQNVTTYDYDELDRVKKVTYPEVNGEQPSTETTYYGNDLVKTRMDMNGSAVTHSYDKAGWLRQRDITRGEGVGGVTYETYDYDGLGRLISAENQYSKVIFDYNEEGCQVSETLQLLTSEGGVDKELDVTSQYDANANRTLMKYPYEDKTINTTWDELDRIDEIAYEGKRLAKYIYDGEKKVVERYLSDSIMMVTQYDLGGRPENIVYKDIKNGKVIFSSDVKYDSADNIEWETALDGKRKELEYNSEGNLVKSEDGNQVTHFHLDGVGNLKKKEEKRKGVLGIFDYEHNERNQLTAFFGLIKIPNPFIEYDKNGNLTKDRDGTTYTYDWNNRMVKAEKPDDVVIEFIYDALGRLIKKIIKVDENVEDSETYSYDGPRVIEDYNHQGELAFRYTYGNELDERVQIELSNSPLASYIPITDRVGSVVALVTEEGQLVERVKYATFGKPTFVYDDAPPRVDVVRLESQDSSLFIRFSEPINKEKAETAIKLIRGTVPISGTITFTDDNQAAIFTGTTLPVNETLTITITTDLADEFGNQLPGEFSKDFINTGTDINIYDRAAPMVMEIRKIGPEFYITFNEEMSSSTTTGAVELTSVQGIFTGDSFVDPEDAKTIRFTPGKALSVGVEYTVAVKSNSASDLCGKGLSEEFSRSFLNEGKDLFIYEKPNPNEHETSRVNNNCLFQGSIYHPELGLYYFRSRFYSPVLGRFMQPDLMGYQDSFNLYEAFNNNPLTYVDPYGMAQKKKGINPNATRSAYARIFKYYISRGMDRDLASDKAMEDLVDLGYIERNAQLKLGTALTAHTGFFYTAMHYVVLPVFELSPAGIFKDVVSLYFGKDLVYGTKLKWWNYAMVGVPFAYKAFKLGRGLGLADEFLDIGDYMTKAARSGPGSVAHKAQRWDAYLARGGKWSYDRWSKQYDINMTNVRRGLNREALYSEALGGENRLIDTPFGKRQIDAFIPGDRIAVQVRTGYDYLTTKGRLANTLAIKKDAWLVKRGYIVEWILEKGGSRNLLEALEKSGIKYIIGPLL